jgi:hypothetical protein
MQLMKTARIRWLLRCLTIFFLVAFPSAWAEEIPQVPRIDGVVVAKSQPAETDPAVIWYDDFDKTALQDRYAEKSGAIVENTRFGLRGGSLEMRYPKGSRGIGGRKVFFGDSPTHRPQVVRGEESFDDVYWRIYVKHPHDWTGGGPAKLSRATSLVPPGWRQAMIAHVWSSGEALTLDPASGVRANSVVTTRYNDFDNLRWLGNKPVSQFKLHGSDGAGWWVCVEARAKLNTPAQRDGINQLWIDGRLEAERRNLDWRGGFSERGINAVFLEAYWNRGSPVDQSRWIDNFVVSTRPIGPVVCPRDPVLIKTTYRGPGSQQSWQLELAADPIGQHVVWRSNPTNEVRQVQVSVETGTFVGRLAGEHELASDEMYYGRVRQQSDSGRWSAWSPWHQPFRTTASE